MHTCAYMSRRKLKFPLICPIVLGWPQRAATFEKLIALRNPSLGTVKIGTVYLEQGSFFGFLSTCPLQGVPLQSLHQTTLYKTTTDLFCCIHLVLSSFSSPQTMARLLSDFCHLTLFLINVLSVNEISTSTGRREDEARESVAGRLQIPLCLGAFMYFY